MVGQIVSRWCQAGQEEGLLIPTEISSLEYESEAKFNAGSVLLTQEQSLPTPPPLTRLLLSLSLPYKMSQQPNYSAIIRQLQEQITTLSKQVVARGGREATNLEIAKPQVYDGTPLKVLEFVMACKLYRKVKIRGVPVEEQIQWVLSYVQGGAADVWKENVLEELEVGELEFETVGEFLAEIKKKFRGGEEKSVKAAELKKLEQGGRTMEEFIQEFKRAARGSGYEGRPLVEEFKRGMNEVIRRKLIKAENQPGSIEQ